MQECRGILPTGSTLNPAFPFGADYFSEGDTLYVMYKLNEKRTRPTRVFSGAGSMSWKIGDEYRCYHDQTGKKLGDYKVVGIYNTATGEKYGDLPDLFIKHAVFK